MRIFEVIVLISIILLIVMGAVFSEGMFRNLSTEGTETINETSTLTQYGITYSWIYVIAVLLIVAVVIIALRITQASVTS